MTMSKQKLVAEIKTTFLLILRGKTGSFIKRQTSVHRMTASDNE